MKVLVATKRGQGIRKNDFCWTDSGEFVTFPFECDGESVDGGCGCRRSMSGLYTHKATTTFEVIDVLSLTLPKYVEQLTESDKAAGWNSTAKDIAALAAELLKVADMFPEQAVLEKRGGEIRVRA